MSLLRPDLATRGGRARQSPASQRRAASTRVRLELAWRWSTRAASRVLDVLEAAPHGDVLITAIVEVEGAAGGEPAAGEPLPLVGTVTVMVTRPDGREILPSRSIAVRGCSCSTPIARHLDLADDHGRCLHATSLHERPERFVAWTRILDELGVIGGGATPVELRTWTID